MNAHVQYLSASWGHHFSLSLHIVVPRALALHESMKSAGEGHCITALTLISVELELALAQT